MTLEQMEREAEKKSYKNNEGAFARYILHLPDIRIYTQNQEKMYGNAA